MYVIIDMTSSLFKYHKSVSTTYVHVKTRKYKMTRHKLKKQINGKKRYHILHFISLIQVIYILLTLLIYIRDIISNAVNDLN